MPAIAVLLAGCVEHPPPRSIEAEPSAPAFETSFPCQSGVTQAQRLVCADATLASLDREMAEAFRRHLREDALFRRDEVLASQHLWLLRRAACPSDRAECLEHAYRDRIRALAAIPAEPPGTGAPDDVAFRVLDARAPELCAVLAPALTASLSESGLADPSRVPGAREIAGSAGPSAGVDPAGRAVAVTSTKVNLFGGYQRRATAVLVTGTAVLSPTAIGEYAVATANGAGRFSVYASRTDDLGAADVFVRDGRPYALLQDPTGYFSPASPGESSLAALFDIAGAAPARACLFATYRRPPDESRFASLPNFAAWRATLDEIRGEPPDAVPPSDRRDASEAARWAAFTLLDRPLLAVAEAERGGWSGWLRHRHDTVLDALYDDGQRGPAERARFDRVFALLRPAADELADAYVHAQGLTEDQAARATALAMMELLYAATVNVAPDIGAVPGAAAAWHAYRARYPVLAAPSG